MNTEGMEFLGYTMRDRITGTQGVVVGLGIDISGFNQLVISPQNKADGEVLESQNFDVMRCEKIDAPKLELPVTPTTFGIELLGYTVKDRITGVQGVAISLTVFSTGCNHICIAPAMKEDGTIPMRRWVDVARAEWIEGVPCVVLENPKLPPAKAVAKTKAATASKPHGPGPVPTERHYPNLDRL